MFTDDRRTISDLLDEGDAPAAPPPEEPTRYALGELIGRGGMGEVRAATDARLEREVAVKLLRDPSAAGRERFLAEARVTARLEHPNIVPVHDLGLTEDGTPYLAMKRVRGRSLAALLTHGQLGPAEHRLEIFRKLCDAVAFAHASGVLHRDLKPENVMVGEFGEVVLMDWGIALPLDPAETAPGMPAGVAGTPAFMAPEQAAGERGVVQSDVYGLGAVLYELMTGRPPFQGPPERVLPQVRRGEFPPPRAVAPRLSSELERVILRAMALAPGDRYPSVVALREDVDAVLAHRPLVHVRSTRVERLGKWMDRHRGAVRATAAAAGLGLVALLLGSWRYGVDVGAARDAAVDAADRASAAETEAVGGLVAAQVALADALGGQGQVLEAERHLREADRLLVGRDLDRRALDLAWSQHVADNPPPIARCAPHGGRAVRALSLSEDGRRALSWGEDGRLVSWDPVGCAELTARALGAAAGPGAVDAERGLGAVIVDGALVTVDLTSGAERRVPAPAGARVVGLDQGALWVRDEDARIWTLPPGAPEPRRLDAPALEGVFWRPALGGRYWLAECTRTGSELGGVWRAGERDPLVSSTGVNSLDLSADGRLLLIGNAMGLIASGLDDLPRWSRDQEPVHAVGVAPGDRVGWAQGFDGSVRVLDLQTGEQLAAYVGPGDLPSAIAATRDARLLAIAGGEGLVLSYLRPAFPARHPPQVHEELAHGLALSPDGQLLAVGTEKGEITLYDVATARPLRSWSGWETGARQLAFSPDGRRLAAAVRYDGIAVLDLASGEARTVPLAVRTVSAAWTPAGLFTVDVEGRIERVDPDSGAVTPLAQGLQAASWGLAPVGADRLLTAGHMGEERGLVLISTVDGRVLRRLPYAQTGYHVAVSPDGARAAVAGSDGTASVLDLASGEVLRTLQADAGPTMGVAFSPDGRLLATTGYARQVKLWDLESGALLRAVRQHEGPGLNVRFSADGSRLYSVGSDGWRVLPLDAHGQHARAVQLLAEPGPARVAGLAALGWWERVEALAGAAPEDRRRVAQARLALGQPAASAGDPTDLLLRLLDAAPR